jgi:hypothetical protein
MSTRRALVWSIVVCCTLTAGCGRPARTPAQPIATARPSTPGSTTVDPPTVLPGPTASVLPSPTAAPASPMLILFDSIELRSGGTRAAEVTRPDRLDEFVDRFALDDPDTRLDYSPREQIEPWRALGARVLAFVLMGCANDGARLVVEPARVYAELTGGGTVQCDAPHYYLAVFAVPAGLIPHGARFG